MTKHQEHILAVRKRLLETIKLVPKVSRKGGFTPYGNFAEKMAEIAKERGSWPWKQKELTTGGAPRDLATSLKKFADAKQGMNTAQLHLVELTCVHFEMEQRVAGGERAGIPFTGATVAETVFSPEPVPASRLRGLEEAVHEATGDPEIAALSTINGALIGLDDYAIKRVLVWAADKHGISLA